MKTRSVLLGAILMAAITPAFAQATPGTEGMKMDQSMPMHQNGSNMQMMMNCMQMHQGMQGKGMKGG